MHITTVCCLIWAVAVICPGNAAALEELGDEALASVTAQTGVGILLDHLYIYTNTDQITYEDPDGLPGIEGDGAALNFNNIEIDILRVEQLGRPDPNEPDKTIYDNQDFHLPFEELYRGGDSAVIPEITGTIFNLDISDRLPVMSAASNYHSTGNYLGNTANVAGIYLGLPTMEFYATEILLDSMTMSSLTSTVPANNNADFGSIYLKGLQIDILNGGVIEIAPHAGCGLDIAFDDTVIYGKLERLFYTDDDLGEYRASRYKDMLVDAIQINALTHLDASGQPESVGRPLFMASGSLTGICNTQQADNYNFAGTGWQNRFLSMDITSGLPAMSALAGGPVAGVYLGLPAQEIFTNHLSYIYTMDSATAADKFLWKKQLTNVDLVFLEGALELAPHHDYGVDITIDDAVLYLSYDQIAYYDMDDGGAFCYNDLEFDVLRVNAIALDASGTLTSPGHGLHFAHALSVPAGFTPSAMTIDMTNNLPKMSEEVGSPMVGISIGLPTIETYADEIGIGSISMQAGLGQDAASADFFRNIRMEGVTHACLGGRMEIAPH